MAPSAGKTSVNPISSLENKQVEFETNEAPKITNLLASTMRVADAETVSFYTQALGMTIVKEKLIGDVTHWLLRFSESG